MASHDLFKERVDQLLVEFEKEVLLNGFPGRVLGAC
jgi:hypothetical protein